MSAGWSMEQVIRELIVLETIITILISGFTVLAMIRRRYRARHIGDLKATYGNKIVEQLILDPLAKSLIDLPTTSMEREALQLALLENLNSITGAERERLEHLYVELGFLGDDSDLAHSIFRRRRLYAVSHLSALKNRSAVPLLRDLVQDNDDIVRAAALLALSAVPGAIGANFDLRQVSKAFRYRRGALCHLLTNLSMTNGIASIFHLLEPGTETHLRDACIQVLMTSRTPEATPQLCRALDHGQLGPSLINEVLICLKGLGDPDCTPSVKALLSHQDERIRARALDLLANITFEPAELQALLAPYMQDESGHVRKTAHQYLDRLGQKEAA